MRNPVGKGLKATNQLRQKRIVGIESP